jgi:hypothetical protein
MESCPLVLSGFAALRRTSPASRLPGFPASVFAFGYAGQVAALRRAQRLASPSRSASIGVGVAIGIGIESFRSVS